MFCKWLCPLDLVSATSQNRQSHGLTIIANSSCCPALEEQVVHEAGFSISKATEQLSFYRTKFCSVSVREGCTSLEIDTEGVERE